VHFQQSIPAPNPRAIETMINEVCIGGSPMFGACLATSIVLESIPALILRHSALDIDRFAGLRAVSAASRIVFRVNISF
jgi:hypothetical protein